MKTIAIFIILFLASVQHLTAVNDVKKIQPLSFNKSDKKNDNSQTIRLKYSYQNVRSFGFNYEIVLPFNFENLSLLTGNKKKSRFGASKPLYQQRFQNLNNVDLNAIVERNKIYNLSKNIQIKSF